MIENSKEFNKFVKKCMVECGVSEKKIWNMERYKNNYKNKIVVVWKSYGYEGWKEKWEMVIEKLKKEGYDGWKLFSGWSYRGDGSVYGMIKEYKK